MNGCFLTKFYILNILMLITRNNQQSHHFTTNGSKMILSKMFLQFKLKLMPEF